MKTTILGALLALAFVSPAIACDYTFDDVAKQFADANSPVTLIPPADIPGLVKDVSASTGETYGDVTRAFVAVTSKGALLGLDVGGCLLSPIAITRGPQTKA